jgi:hypothetical protein
VARSKVSATAEPSVAQTDVSHLDGDRAGRAIMGVWLSRKAGRRRRLDHATFRVGAGLHPVVKVVVKGADLAKLQGQAVASARSTQTWSARGSGGGRAGEAVRVDDAVCFEARFVPKVYVSVLPCSCGNFGDGGAIARIIVFDHDVVTWSDFETVERRKVEAVGPFRLGRRQYTKRSPTQGPDVVTLRFAAED